MALRGGAGRGLRGLLTLVGVLALGVAVLRLALRPDPALQERNALPAAASVPAPAEALADATDAESRRMAIEGRRVGSADSDPRGERAAKRPQSSGARGPRTDLEYQAELRALARSDPEGFDRRFAAISAGTGPASEELALLRVAYEERPGAVAGLARAVSTLSQASGSKAESVPQAFVNFLGQRGAREARARETLSAIAWNQSPCAETTLRVRALRDLILCSPEEDVLFLTRRINAENDPVLHSAGIAVLEERAHPAAPLEPHQETP